MFRVSSEITTSSRLSLSITRLSIWKELWEYPIPIRVTYLFEGAAPSFTQKFPKVHHANPVIWSRVTTDGSDPLKSGRTMNCRRRCTVRFEALRRIGRLVAGDEWMNEKIPSPTRVASWGHCLPVSACLVALTIASRFDVYWKADWQKKRRGGIFPSRVPRNVSHLRSSPHNWCAEIFDWRSTLSRKENWGTPFLGRELKWNSMIFTTLIWTTESLLKCSST